MMTNGDHEGRIFLYHPHMNNDSFSCSLLNTAPFMCFFFCLVFVMPLYASVYMCVVVTCWERADLLALFCGV